MDDQWETVINGEPRTYSKGDYLLIDAFPGARPAWVEFGGSIDGRLRGRLRSDPVPPGHADNDEVSFDFLAIIDIIPAAEVGDRVLRDFFRLPSTKATDGFNAAWNDEDRRARRPITVQQHRALNRHRPAPEPDRCGLPDFVRIVVAGLILVALAALAAAIWILG